MRHLTDDTICAISTAPGVGGIAVIRISGPQASVHVNSIYSKDVKAQDPMTLSYGQIMDGEDILDDVIVARFQGPHSFTGEDVVEISCHGSVYIQERILQLLIAQGCRAATRGEFTQRAFLHGKMDLSQAEAVADLIASESRSAHRMAIQQMKGEFSQEIVTLRTKLIEFASLIELELDFSEEDVEFADRDDFKRLIRAIIHRVDELIESFQLGNVIKKGVPVAIIGAPNSGKSTLLNALLKEQRAIVSDIAGTTRDAIEDTVNIGGVTFRFIDTAGVRETEDQIENQGIAIALDKAKHAAIVIKLLDARQELLDEEERLYNHYFDHVGWRDDERTIRVLNKIDLTEGRDGLPQDAIGISALTGEGLNSLKDKLLERIEYDGTGQRDIVVSNLRHLHALQKTSEALHTVVKGMEQGISSDLLAIDIRKALHYLGEVTGEVTTDDLLGTIFSKFCIGK
ncbi:MAG: tRNA uridine-5-carboxymethylaminomethyl(34) synthesis GTPase MnmE [Flavobacteriales bacterium]|nr:tRNA uridine-5-carboxymethylaminomethyl(34) synthesis GTPase MnmE [Flavobacteriales bacterium]